MRWEDERYVRVYTRDTPEWCALSWQARGLFLLLLREVDRAGVLPLGKLGRRSVAVAVRASMPEIEDSLQELLNDGCLVINGTSLVIPNFIEAQEARQSDRARQRKSRETARNLAATGSVTKRDGLSHTDDSNDDDHLQQHQETVSARLPESQPERPDVTKRDGVSRSVTACHETPHGVTQSHTLSHAVTPSLAVLNLAVPSQELPPHAPPPGDAGRRKRATANERLVAKHDLDARAVLGALNEARSRVNPRARGITATVDNLRLIAERLEAGASADDCRHVISAVEAECHRDASVFRWFDAVTPFRPENFSRKVAALVEDAPGAEERPRRLPLESEVRGLVRDEITRAKCNLPYLGGRDPTPEEIAIVTEYQRGIREAEQRAKGVSP